MEEYFKTHSFFDFVSGICERVKPITRQIKPITEKIVNSFIYIWLSYITTIVAFIGIMYKSFFHDDFIARTTLYIIYLVMIACTALSRLIKATVVDGRKRTEELVFGGMWVFIFLANLIDFLCS